MSSLFDEIRGQLDFAELVSRTTKLTHYKGEQYKGLSPFNREDTPSFYVNNSSQTWYDFSSGQGGGILDFVMKTQHMGREEALIFLADYLGIEYEEEDNDEYTRLRKVLKAAHGYFRNHKDSAFPYIESRGFDAAVVDKYELGYVENGGLLSYLKMQGFTDAEMIGAGVAYDDNGEAKPRFYKRVMIPIKDAYGRIVSFTGRDTTGNAKAKYLHGPITKVFEKKGILWNLSLARKEIGEQDRVVVCEGQMDAIAITETGIPAVAILGSTITEEQMTLLAKVTSNIYNIFDSDDAGERGLLKAFKMAAKLGVDSIIYSIILSGKDDPEDYINKHGKDAFREVVERAKPDTSNLVQVLLRQNIKGSQSKAAVARKVLKEVEPYLRQQFTYRSIDLIERLSQELGLSRKELFDWIEAGANFQHNSNTYKKIDSIMDFPAPVYERRLLYALLDEPHKVSQFKQTGMSVMDFDSYLVSKVVSEIEPTMDSAQVFDHLQETLKEEEYYKVLAFFSQGIVDNDFDTALDVMKHKVYDRTRKPKTDFLGRPVKASEKELKGVVKEIMEYDKEPF